jgi:hypothetical protein
MCIMRFGVILGIMMSIVTTTVLGRVLCIGCRV